MCCGYFVDCVFCMIVSAYSGGITGNGRGNWKGRIRGGWGIGLEHSVLRNDCVVFHLLSEVSLLLK
jgi:hypothetical protein